MSPPAVLNIKNILMRDGIRHRNRLACPLITTTPIHFGIAGTPLQTPSVDDLGSVFDFVLAQDTNA